jgi:hypothetical protein
LTKSEVGAIHIPIGGILSGASGLGREILWLFDTCLNPRASWEAEEIFSSFFGRKPLKSLDSEK